MRRLAILLWGWATVGCGGNNSRFGDFYSRQGDKNSRQGLLRELARNGLIWLAVFCAKPALTGQKRKNSRFHGNNWERRSGGLTALGRLAEMQPRRNRLCSTATSTTLSVHPSAG